MSTAGHLTLSQHQAAAVAQFAEKIARRPAGKRSAERTVTVGFLGSDFAPHPPGPGLYCWPTYERAAPSPLFARPLPAERTFDASRLPARDADGHVQHPDMDGIGEEEFDFGPQLRAIGWESTTTSFEHDADAAMRERYDEQNSPDCSYWTPTPPTGEGWLLAAIYDTEDGPVALYVRKAAESHSPFTVKADSAQQTLLAVGIRCIEQLRELMTHEASIRQHPEKTLRDACVTGYDGALNVLRDLLAEYPHAPVLTDAARDVLGERSRQVHGEGWDALHDDDHDRGELARAAACYALHAGSCLACPEESYQRAAPHHGDPVLQETLWPWAFEWWKPKNPRRDLVRAAALILAEIERLDRQRLTTGAEL